MMQAFLNASDYYLWGIVTNGDDWCLMRDNPALSRPTYFSIDLSSLLRDRDVQVFDGLFWRFLHVSRASRKLWDDPTTCLWEEWRQDLEAHGIRAREGLRDGVEQAIRVLGNGFLNSPDNTALRDALQSEELSTNDYYQELLRLVYRFIFLTVLEERDLLHAHDKSLKSEAEVYKKGYSLARLVPATLYARTAPGHDDLWEAQRIVFRGLAQDGGLPQLALPGLGGLFDHDQCPHLEESRLSNKDFLTAMGALRWARSSDDKKSTKGRGKKAIVKQVTSRIDYNNLGTEELGSVYESLLELTPQLILQDRLFGFVQDAHKKSKKGSDRKTTGSYYTPTCLVDQMLDNALTPLLDRCCANPVEAQKKLLALRVIDPACGSGHFLLGAARRIADRLAHMRTIGRNGVSNEVWQRAMHDVIRNCIYGVDINPMAVELARMNLWLEGYLPTKALSFLDDHLQSGNSILGLMTLKSLEKGIPDEAFEAIGGDDKSLCSKISKSNKEARNNWSDDQTFFNFTKPQESVTTLNLDGDSPSQVRALAKQYRELCDNRATSPEAIAADLWLGAFILPKTAETPLDSIPTSSLVREILHSGQIPPYAQKAVTASRQACRNANVFHWELRFPDIFHPSSDDQTPGFDLILGNPPWERPKLQDQEYFATRYPAIAKATGNTRKNYIKLLSEGKLAAFLNHREDLESLDSEIKTYETYLSDKRLVSAQSKFFHVSKIAGGRYPLSGTGDVNMYALFTELIIQIRNSLGSASFIVPTNIATDNSTKALFQYFISSKILTSIYDFENSEGLFPSVHRSYKFSAVTLAPQGKKDLVFYLKHPRELADGRRHIDMAEEDFKLFNPNTWTSPIFRCLRDKELSFKIYSNVPIFIKDSPNENNSWGIYFNRLLDMTNDSKLFLKEKGEDTLPLYEGKMVHLYDHRWASAAESEDQQKDTGSDSEEEVSTINHLDPTCEPTPRYWVLRSDVIRKLPQNLGQIPRWFFGFRNISNATNERTLICSVFPFSGVGNSMPIILLGRKISTQQASCLLANLSSLILDYVVRLKVGGTNLNFFYVKQFPVLPPEAYRPEDIEFISSRVLELTYASESMRPWAEDIGYTGAPFPWDEERRAQLKAELDAYIAKMYGLTREDVEYILDPTDFFPEGDCPTVTFPGLKRHEIKAYGEYRTQRLVLQAFDQLSNQQLV
jgi:type I restriction-modification system DNA methylase subunit